MSFISLLNRKLGGARDFVRRRLHERIIPGREIGERIKIYDLVYPLRYDILVRADFIRFLAENEQLPTSDIGMMLEHPAARAYQAWFKEVAVRRFSSEIYNDHLLVQERFRERVEKVRRLWESITSQGFDHSTPVRLGGGRDIIDVNGKIIDASYFAGDGCHRTACLLVMGKAVLEPEEYEVLWTPTFRPLDNTAILIEKLPIGMAVYLSYISDAYCEGRPLATAEDLMTDVREHSPAKLTEVESVLRHDLPLLHYP